MKMRFALMLTALLPLMVACKAQDGSADVAPATEPATATQAPATTTEPQAATPAEAGMWVEDDGNWTAQSMSDQLDSSLENVFPDDPGTSERLAPDLSAQWKSASGGALGGAEGA